MSSEVAQLRQQIINEYTAAYAALHSFAVVARHDVIHARLDRALAASEELIAIVGVDQAMPIIVEAMERH